MSAITLKRFTPRDAGAVSQLFRAVYDTRYPQPDVYLPGMITQRNASGHWYSLLAWDQARMVGHAALCQSADDHQQAELAMLVVHPDFQGRRIATHLCQELLVRAERLRLTTLSIKQVTSHAYTQRLARNIGFHNCGVLPDYVPSPFGLYPQETMVMGCQMMPGHARPLPEVEWPSDCYGLMEPLLRTFGKQAPAFPSALAPMTTSHQQQRVEVVVERLNKDTLAQLCDFPGHWWLSIKLSLSPSFNRDLEQLSGMGFSFTGLIPAPGPSGWLALFHRVMTPRTLNIECTRMQRLARFATH